MGSSADSCWWWLRISKVSWDTWDRETQGENVGVWLTRELQMTSTSLHLMMSLSTLMGIIVFTAQVRQQRTGPWCLKSSLLWQLFQESNVCTMWKIVFKNLGQTPKWLKAIWWCWIGAETTYSPPNADRSTDSAGTQLLKPEAMKIYWIYGLFLEQNSWVPVIIVVTFDTSMNFIFWVCCYW